MAPYERPPKPKRVAVFFGDRHFFTAFAVVREVPDKLGESNLYIDFPKDEKENVMKELAKDLINKLKMYVGGE